MERIRVDTDELKTKSNALETSAGIFAQAGKDILAYAASMPSYDGQLSTPARAAALEINRQCQDVYSLYLNDAQSLARTAQAFADVDNQTVDVFGENTALLSESPLYGGPGGEVIPPDSYTVTSVTESDGSITTTEITRTHNPDGTVTERRVVTNKKVFNRKTAKEWNDDRTKIIFGLGKAFAFLALIFGIPSALFATVLSEVYDFLTTFYLTPTYEEGDILYTRWTTVTTEYPDGTRDIQYEMIQTQLIDRDGVIKQDDWRKIDKAGLSGN